MRHAILSLILMAPQTRIASDQTHFATGISVGPGAPFAMYINAGPAPINTIDPVSGQAAAAVLYLDSDGGLKMLSSNGTITIPAMKQ